MYAICQDSSIAGGEILIAQQKLALLIISDNTEVIHIMLREHTKPGQCIAHLIGRQ